MSDHLDTKQYVPVTADERQLLRDEASARGIGAGLLARVLLIYGLEHIDDQELIDRIGNEKSATKQRISAGARVAIQARWGSSDSEEK